MLTVMCFYNQKLFACGCFGWNGFSHRCNREYRTGETCGLKFVNRCDSQKARCRICEKIETKERRIGAENERLSRWERDGGTLVASMERSRNLIEELKRDKKWLEKERNERKITL
jgi:hypothetical protein